MSSIFSPIYQNDPSILTNSRSGSLMKFACGVLNVGCSSYEITQIDRTVEDKSIVDLRKTQSHQKPLLLKIATVIFCWLTLLPLLVALAIKQIYQQRHQLRCVSDSPAKPSERERLAEKNGPRKKIVVFSKDANGYGDLAFGLKVCKRLKKQFPRADTVFVTDSPVKASHLNGEYKQTIIGEKRQSVEDRLSPETVRKAISQFNPDLVVYGPVVDKKDQYLPDKNFKVLRIAEYAWGQRISEMNLNKLKKDEQQGNGNGVYGSGLGEGDTGILIHEELHEWAKKKDVTSRERLEFLKDLPDEITTLLLNEKIDNEALDTFDKSNCLFVGYSAYAQSKAEFIFSISEMLSKTEDNNDASLFLIGINSDNNFNLLNFLQNNKESLKEQGINEVDVVDIDSKVTTNISTGFVVESRKIRVFLKKRLDSLHLKALLKASEKEVLTTGDQFFSECASANKNWIREYILHKKTFTKDIVSVARKVDENFSHIFHEAHCLKRPLFLNPLKKPEGKTKTWASYKADVLIYGRQHPDVYTKFNGMICDKHNFYTWLTPKVEEMLQIS